MTRRKNNLIYLIILVSVIGLLTGTSCKRNSVPDPDTHNPAGFRIILSGVADPSTLYIPQGEPAVSSLITVTALNNDGTPVVGRSVVFQVSSYGYLNNYQISDVQTTNQSGMAHRTFFIPAQTNIRSTTLTEVKVTLIDDGRLDSTVAQITDTIPIKIIPYMEQGLIIHGNVRTPTGNGVGEVTILLEGEDGNSSAVTVTRPSGSYEFFVPSGWYGTITPDASGYSFVPDVITFTSANAIYQDTYNQDFVAIFAGGNNLATDVESWDNIPQQGGTITVNVYNGTGDSSISYIVLPNAEWITVNPTTGYTPGSFTITVDENNTGDDRSADVTVTSTDTDVSEVTISIDQLGHDVVSTSTLAVDRSTINVVQAGNTEVVNIYNSTSSDTIDFILTTNDTWLTIPASGSTNTDIEIEVDPNIGAARTGTVTVTATSTGVANPTVTITINQEGGGSISLDVTSRNVLAAGETFTVNVTNPTTSDPLHYEIDDPTWVQLSSDEGITPGQFTVTVEPNNTGSDRSGTITVTADNGAVATLTIYQQG